MKLCLVPGRAAGAWSRGMSLCVASLAPALEWHSEGINRGRPTDHCARQNVASAVLGSAKCLRSLLNRSPFLSPPLSSVPLPASPLYVVVSVCESPFLPSLPLFTFLFYLFSSPPVPFFSPAHHPTPSSPSSVSFFHHQPPPPTNPLTTSHTLPHICRHVLSAAVQPPFQFRV